MGKLLNTIQNILWPHVGNDSLSNLSEESYLSSSNFPITAPLEPLASAPVKSAEQWPPLPDSPSSRPSRSAPALFTAHMLRNEGCSDHHYEDAAAFNIFSGFAAVADGVTMGSRSDLFADSLVRHFVQGEFYLDQPGEQEKEGKRKKPGEREKWWEICSREWEVQTVRLYEGMSAEEQQQHASGSGATFIGFWIDPKRGACLYSVGDCYGLWFADGKYTQAFPKESQFNNSPMTIDTRHELRAEKLATSKFDSLPGDMLVLCSDALAEYLFARKPWEHQPDFWQDVEAMNDHSFGKWTEERKSAGELKDDDYTLLMLRFPGKASFEYPLTTAATKTEIFSTVPSFSFR